MLCPICVTETGRAVRDALAAESLATCLVATAGPFIFIALAIWSLYRAMDDGWSRSLRKSHGEVE